MTTLAIRCAACVAVLLPSLASAQDAPTACNGATVLGSGCGSGIVATSLSCSGDWALASTAVAKIEHATASVSATFMIGPSGLTPVDLTPFGAPGCSLYTLPVGTVPAFTDAAGEAELTVDVPFDPGLQGFALVLQAAVIDPLAAPAPIATTNALDIRVQGPPE